MIVTCPLCGDEIEVSRRHLGTSIDCPACGGAFRPVTEVPTAHVHRPERKQSGAWVIGLVLPLALIPMIVAVFCMMGGGTPNNARCPGCGREMFISKRLLAENGDVPCFFCGKTWQAGAVFVGDIRR